MIGILLVTAYNGMWWQGRQAEDRPVLHPGLHPGLQQIPQTASRAHCLPAGIPAGLPGCGQADGRAIWQQLAASLPPAAGDRNRNNRIV